MSYNLLVTLLKVHIVIIGVNMLLIVFKTLRVCHEERNII